DAARGPGDRAPRRRRRGAHADGDDAVSHHAARAALRIGSLRAVEHLRHDRVDGEGVAAAEILAHVRDPLLHAHEIVHLAQAVNAGVRVDAHDHLGDLGRSAADAVVAGAPQTHRADIRDLHLRTRVYILTGRAQALHTPVYTPPS